MIDFWNYGGYVTAAAAVIALVRKEIGNIAMYGVKVLTETNTATAALASTVATDAATAGEVVASLAPAGSVAQIVGAVIAQAAPAAASAAVTAQAAVAAQPTILGKAESAGESLLSFGLPILQAVDPAAATLISGVLGGLESIYNAIATHKATVTSTTTTAA